MIYFALKNLRIYDRDAALAIQEKTDKALLKCGALVEREAKKSMRKGGRRKGPRGGKVREPSAPGTPPNVQTGNLRRSITYARIAKNRVLIGPTPMAWYGKLHELGGQFGRRYFPQRAFMIPALERARERFASIFMSEKLADTEMGRKLIAQHKARMRARK